jgi:hypothetical protein
MVAPPPVRHRIPLGLLMLSKGQLTNGQLRTGLDMQREHGGRIGQTLQRMGFVTEQQVTAALASQWACPVLSPVATTGSNCERKVPSRLLLRFQMLPVHFAPATRILHVAFSEGVEYTVLHGIERMLDCRTAVCLVAQSTMDLAMERFSHQHRSNDLLFEGWRDSDEMGRITCGFVLKLGIQQLRTVTCADYIWARLEGRSEITNLLFRRPMQLDRMSPYIPSSVCQGTG